MTILNSILSDDIIVNECENEIFLLDNCIKENELNTLLNFTEANKASFGKIFSATEDIEKYYSESGARPKALFIDKRNPAHSDIDALCFSIFKNINTIFSKYQHDVHRAQVATTGDTGYRFSIYDPINNSYKFHTDAGFTNKGRRVSVIICLNDDYEGGELHFPKFKTKIKLKARQCILFPSIWTHPHEVTPVVSGERKTLMTWFI